jgi:hypothetical protein
LKKGDVSVKCLTLMMQKLHYITLAWQAAQRRGDVGAFGMIWSASGANGPPFWGDRGGLARRLVDLSLALKRWGVAEEHGEIRC